MRKGNFTAKVIAEYNLQWGRNMRVAESNEARAKWRAARALQWGRNMRVAERLAAPGAGPLLRPFNGAAT